MYAGHIGIALGAKRARPDVSLAVIIVASLSLDLLVHPMVHTLPVAAGVTAVVFGVDFARHKDLARSGLLAGLVVSHIGADFLTSYLELWPGGPEAGLSLYNGPAADFALEAFVIVVGWWLYRFTLPATTRSAPRVYGLLGWLLFFQAFYDVRFAATALD
jgi:hypothetical protein